MSRWSPEPNDGLTPVEHSTETPSETPVSIIVRERTSVIDHVDSTGKRVSSSVLRSSTPVVVKENSASSFLSESNSQDQTQRELLSSTTSVRPIIASATQIQPRTPKFVLFY